MIVCVRNIYMSHGIYDTYNKEIYELFYDNDTNLYLLYGYGWLFILQAQEKQKMETTQKTTFRPI